ncbi:hypothetical protein GCM10009539_12320 [Cryptosporangium japonicum]|uniref:Uncharacterized protein n=1 Tax=Cryptosporangium japonicum TaxID=80872 RepID=A0ABN0TRR4_9ACTN
MSLGRVAGVVPELERTPAAGLALLRWTPTVGALTEAGRAALAELSAAAPESGVTAAPGLELVVAPGPGEVRWPGRTADEALLPGPPALGKSAPGAECGFDAAASVSDRRCTAVVGEGPDATTGSDNAGSSRGFERGRRTGVKASRSTPAGALAFRR